MFSDFAIFNTKYRVQENVAKTAQSYGNSYNLSSMYPMGSNLVQKFSSLKILQLLLFAFFYLRFITFSKTPLNRDLGLTLNPLLSSYRQFILPNFERPYLGHFLSKFDDLYVHGKLIKSFTSLIRGIFLIWGQIHAYVRRARLLRQFCTVSLKRL